MKTKFRIINKSNNIVISKSKPRDVAVFMWGRSIDAYLVIKSDLNGDRIVKFTSSELSQIEIDCKDA